MGHLADVQPKRVCRLCYRGGSLWRGGLPGEPGTFYLGPASLSSLSIFQRSFRFSHLLSLFSRRKTSLHLSLRRYPVALLALPASLKRPSKGIRLQSLYTRLVY